MELDCHAFCAMIVPVSLVLVWTENSHCSLRERCSLQTSCAQGDLHNAAAMPLSRCPSPSGLQRPILPLLMPCKHVGRSFLALPSSSIVVCLVEGNQCPRLLRIVYTRLGQRDRCSSLIKE